MDCKVRIKELRESTGMNRKEFCDYFQIPYRTVTDWERGNRHAPEYVLRLLEYFIRMEGMSKIREDSNKGSFNVLHNALEGKYGNLRILQSKYSFTAD